MKYKLPTLAFALSIIALSIYGILQPSYELGLFLGLNSYFTQLRIMIAAILLVYVFIPAVRLKVTQVSMLFCGILFLGTGIAAMLSPVILGEFSRYMVIGDLVISIESGVLAILLAAELPVKHVPQRTDLIWPAFYLYHFALKGLAPIKPRTQFHQPPSVMPKLSFKQTAKAL